MRNNRISLLAGILVVLVGVAWFTGVFESNPSTMDLPRLGIPAKEVERIDVEAPSVSITLLRENGAWRVDRPIQASADTAAVGRLVRDLAGVKLGSVVSTNASRHSQYGVDSTAAEVVATWDGGEERLVVSTRGPDYSTNYVRIGASDVVYATRTRILVPTLVDRLRDRTALRLDPAMVVRVAVTRPEESYEVARETAAWTLTEGTGDANPADSVSVASWLRRFEPLTADGFVTDLDADSVRAESSVNLLITTIDGASHRLFLADHDNAVAGALATGRDVFRFFRGRLDGLAPMASTLKKTP